MFYVQRFSIAFKLASGQYVFVIGFAHAPTVAHVVIPGYRPLSEWQL